MSFTYKGISSDAMGLNITERSVYSAPAYDLNAVSVPGRSGDVLNPQNRFKNKKITYTGFIRSAGFTGSTDREKLSNALIALKGWLCSDAGQYNDLTDDYDPGFTRKAYIDGETGITEIHNRAKGVTVNITFSAEPFMRQSDALHHVFPTSGGTITNPYAFASLPRLEIEMTGTDGVLTITNSEGTSSWTISGYDSARRLFVDSETMDWYNADMLQNNLVSGSGFPILAPGVNTISWTGDIFEVVVYPRWRTL